MVLLENVTKIFPGTPGNKPVVALQECNLEIRQGAFCVITGRSGCGKTTLLNLIAGLTAPTSGRVLFHGRNWLTLSDQARSLERARKIGFVFQFPSLLPSLTSMENVIFPVSFDPNLDPKRSYSRARDLLGSLDLGDEPTSDLDDQTEYEIMELFQRIHSTTQTTVVLVTHSTQLVRFGTLTLNMMTGKSLRSTVNVRTEK
jgi:ABC-type lipoprotein export system ATPase subunit